MYSCKQCGAQASVSQDGRLLKTCSCACGVYMDMGALRLKGTGALTASATSLNWKKALQVLKQAADALGLKLSIDKKPLE